MPSYDIHWLSDQEYAKAVGQFRLQLNAVFEPLRMYGQGVFCDGAVDEVVRLAEDFGLRVRGVDKPISYDRVKTR